MFINSLTLKINIGYDCVEAWYSWFLFQLKVISIIFFPTCTHSTRFSISDMCQSSVNSRWLLYIPQIMVNTGTELWSNSVTRGIRVVFL